MDGSEQDKALGNNVVVMPQTLHNSAGISLPLPTFVQQSNHSTAVSQEAVHGVLSHIQQMLDQLGTRGVNSFLVTVDSLGDVNIHGSQKGQQYIKDNPFITERFIKSCSDDVWTLLGAQKRFLEIGRQQQNMIKPGTCTENPIDFSHERTNFFPAHSGTGERPSLTQENTFVQGILTQSNPGKTYQPNSFIHSSFPQFDSRQNTFFQGGFNQGLSCTESFPQASFMQGMDSTANVKDNFHNPPQSSMIPQAHIGNPQEKTNTNGISQSEADLIKEMLTSTPVQEVINSAISKSESSSKEKSSSSKSKSDSADKSKDSAAKKKRERRPETWQRNIKKKLKTEGKEYVNAKGKLIPAKKLMPVDCSKCKQKCTDKISEETRRKIFDWFWKLGSYTAQKEFVISRVTQVATKTSKRRQVHRLFSFEINGKYEPVCKPFFSRTLGIGDSYIYKAFEQKARDLFVSDGRGKHSPANKTTEDQVTFMHEHLEKNLAEFPVDKPLPKNIHAQKWYDEYNSTCIALELKPVSKHIYRKIFQEFVRKYPPGLEKKKDGDASSSSDERPSSSHQPTSSSSIIIPASVLPQLTAVPTGSLERAAASVAINAITENYVNTQQ